jgi:hypothetical protein
MASVAVSLQMTAIIAWLDKQSRTFPLQLRPTTMAAFQDAFEDADEALVVNPSVISFQSSSTAASLAPAAPSAAIDACEPAGVSPDAAEAADDGTYEEYYSSEEECDESLYDLEDLAGRAGSRSANEPHSLA